ncbi:alpha/beta fold hydrolase [Streptomyces sp. Ac-502]|uniref:alpha/beta fold hydrolase n=1 Tax=Streptomyces sp. Ac-502 TaxID=3342801 RepID=UPI0038627BDE
MAAVLTAADRTKALKKLRLPATVLHGTHDPLVPVACARATARAIPGARLRVIPGMGHHFPPRRGRTCSTGCTQQHNEPSDAAVPSTVQLHGHRIRCRTMHRAPVLTDQGNRYRMPRSGQWLLRGTSAPPRPRPLPPYRDRLPRKTPAAACPPA